VLFLFSRDRSLRFALSDALAWSASKEETDKLLEGLELAASLRILRRLELVGVGGNRLEEELLGEELELVVEVPNGGRGGKRLEEELLEELELVGVDGNRLEEELLELVGVSCNVIGECGMRIKEVPELVEEGCNVVGGCNELLEAELEEPG
jgi:hypothetical protein